MISSVITEEMKLSTRFDRYKIVWKKTTFEGRAIILSVCIDCI